MDRKTTKQYITLKDSWSYLVNNIWLFVTSIVVFLSIAIAYIVVTPPTYRRTASILIKSDEQRDAVSSVLSLDGKGGVLNNNIDINNEVNILQMSQLMDDVVERLSLHDSYSVKFRNARWVDIYHDAPIKVVLDTLLSNYTLNIEFSLKHNGRFEIVDMTINGNKIKSGDVKSYGDTISTSYGTFQVERAPWITGEPTQSRYIYSRTTIAHASAKYLQALTVAIRSRETSIIDLSLVDGSRDKADDILNTLISVYNENWIKDKNTIKISTTNFINERLKIIEKELGAVDQNISNYKSDNLLPDVQAVSNINLQSSNEILRTQVSLNNQLSMAQYILQYVQDATTDNQLLPVNTGVDDSSIESQVAIYNDLLMRKNALLSSSSVNNPVISDMVNELSRDRGVIAASINEFINTLKFKIENSRKEEIVTRNRLSQNPSQELYLLSTGREQMVKEQLYLFLLQKREENELNQVFSAYNTKVLSYAKGSGVPVEPKRNVILLLGLAIGVMLPIIVLIVRDSFNTVVRDKSDLKEISIPYLGAIPQIGKSGFWAKYIKGESGAIEESIVVNNSRDAINESFRVVRTNLDFMSGGSTGCRCIAITSINPTSGKSFISLNLAASLAIKSSRVLVVDTDLRRGTLSGAVDSPAKGLVNYLSSTDTPIESVIQRGLKYPTLDILPMGVMPPNPTELLLLDRFKTLVEELRQKYDYILFDCPPVDIVSDAAIVDMQCDSTIFIVRAGLMEKELLVDLDEFYKNKVYKDMSLILNGVNYGENRKYGYGGHSKYGYGNYYGYGNKDKKQS